jgi:hypothetical protein
MPDLQGQQGEVRMTIQVKRAATGETETHELVGTLTAEQAEELGITTTETTQEK